MKLRNTNWNYPTTIWFGAGRINDLPLSCQKMEIKRPLLVTDKGMVKMDIIEDEKRILKEERIDITIYSYVHVNSTDGNVLIEGEYYVKIGHDGVIAFGGG